MLFGKWTFFTVKSLVTLIFIGWMGISVAEAAPQCRNILRLVPPSEVSSIITALAKTRLTLDEAKVQGNQETLIRVLSPQFIAKEKEVASLLQDNGIMTKTELIAEIKKEILRLQGGKKEVADKKVRSQEEVKKILDLDYYRHQMIFHDLPSGMLRYGPRNDSYRVDKFAMLATPVTQKMWATIWEASGKTDLAILTPSSKPFTGKLKILGLELEMNPDHPVDRFDASMMNKFLIALNTLTMSRDPQVQTLLKELIPDHQDYDIYDLPTDQQWEYVRTNMGTTYKEFFDRDDGSEVSLYGWIRSEDFLEIHPVALLQPRLINNKPFYDLEGNALEYTKTTTPEKFNIVRGLIKISDSTSLPLNSAYPGVSFRLIRIRP